MKTAICFLIFTLLTAYEIRSADEVFIHSLEARYGKSYKWTISYKDALALVKWSPDGSEVPLSTHKAVIIANRWLKKKDLTGHLSGDNAVSH